MKRLAAWLACCLFCAQAGALTPDEVIFDTDDAATFDSLIVSANAQSLDRLPYGRLVQAIATQPALLGRAYSKGPLENTADEGDPKRERLYAGFARFDCVTFVETVLGVAGAVATHAPSSYAANVAALRYRDGRPAYCSRLHYFSDWIHRSVEQGRLDDVTRGVSGDADHVAFATWPNGMDFMSRNASHIAAFSGDETRLACVQEMEKNLSISLPHDDSGQVGFDYIPDSFLAQAMPRLQSGDIVAFVSDTPGLDYIHVGIVVVDDDGRRSMVHASQRYGRVAVTPDLLSYALKLPRQRGLTVLRARTPVPTSR